MTPLGERLRQNLRLTVLRFLEAGGDYTLNVSTLVSVLRDYGMAETRTGVEAELVWLKERGLVTLERPIESLLVARLTTAGLEAAQGVAVVEGVARPAPGG